MKNGIYHLPVLKAEVVEFLKCRYGGIFVDCTLGTGGHALEILKCLPAQSRFIGIDWDSEALMIAQERLKKYTHLTSLVKDNFVNLREILRKERVNSATGILFDLGTSRYQLKTPRRGFSFLQKGPLDMRMSFSLQITAAEIVNTSSRSELEELIRSYGEEKLASRVAKAIVENRPFHDTLQLAQCIEKTIARVYQRQKLHPATRTFQALRIAVNRELDNLREALPEAIISLAPGGRVCVISYHSGEDRITKEIMEKYVHQNIIKVITPSPLQPGEEECANNPSARSAKLRVSERL